MTTMIPDPSIDPENERYWQAANREELLVALCGNCGEYHHYPRSHCPLCGSTEVTWQVAGGTGRLYSKSTFVRAEVPYTLAWVVLEEGVGFLTNLVDCDPEQVAIADPVTVVFHPSRNGQLVPMVTAAEAPPSAPAR